MILLLLACGTEPVVTEAQEAPVIVQPVGSGVEMDDLNAMEDRVNERLNKLEERVGNLELTVIDMENRPPGGMANEIGFDPSRTTLDSRDLQGAIDELEDRVARLQNQSHDMGEPGEELFNIPRDNQNLAEGGGPRNPPGGNKQQDHKAPQNKQPGGGGPGGGR